MPSATCATSAWPVTGVVAGVGRARAAGRRASSGSRCTARSAALSRARGGPDLVPAQHGDVGPRGHRRRVGPRRRRVPGDGVAAGLCALPPQPASASTARRQSARMGRQSTRARFPGRRRGDPAVVGARAAMTAAVAATLALAADAQAAFPGRDGLIAFTRAEGSKQGQLYLVRPDGSGLRRITHRRHGAGGASWSPDGRPAARPPRPSTPAWGAERPALGDLARRPDLDGRARRERDAAAHPRPHGRQRLGRELAAALSVSPMAPRSRA